VGPEGSAPAQSRTGEIQYYTDNKNAFLDGEGHFVIQARKESKEACPDPNSNGPCYTSARLSTKGLFSQEGGQFEARIKMPIGNTETDGGGVWPAWWLLGRNGRKHPDQGEIDIDESTGQKRITHGFFHGPRPGSFGGQLTLPDLDLTQFHTFAVDVEPTQITWYIDGTEVSATHARSIRGGASRRKMGRRSAVVSHLEPRDRRLAGQPIGIAPVPEGDGRGLGWHVLPIRNCPLRTREPDPKDQSYLDKERVRCAEPGAVAERRQ
jgi:Glycosyl hydrolases family 16